MNASISFGESVAFVGHIRAMTEKPDDNAAIGRRIKELREDNMGLSQENFAKHLGVTRGAVGNWELGKGIKRENLQRIALTFDQPLEWIMTGRGSAVLDGRQNIAPRTNNLVGSFDPDDDDVETVETGQGYNADYWKPRLPGSLPELDVAPGAGQGMVGDVINIQTGADAYSAHKVVAEWVMPDQFLRHEMKASQQHSIVMEVRGDSMQPTFLPGDRVIVDLSQNEMSVDGVYVYSDGHGEPQIKRLQKIPFTDPVMVRIISENMVFVAFDVELARLHIVGRVCGHVARK